MLLSILKALYSFEAIVKVKAKYCVFEKCWYVRKAAVDNRDLPGGRAKEFLKLNYAKFCLAEHVVPNHWESSAGK